MFVALLYSLHPAINDVVGRKVYGSFFSVFIGRKFVSSYVKTNLKET